MPTTPVLQRLPTLEQVERELTRNLRERRLLQAMRHAMRRKHRAEQAGRRLAQRNVELER